jgi:hypothetical protein
MFGIAGASVALTGIAKQEFGSAWAMAITIVILCHFFGAQPSRDDCRWPIVSASTWTKPYNLSGARFLLQM